MYVVFGEISYDDDDNQWWLIEGFMEKNDAERLRLEYQNAHVKIYDEWRNLYRQFDAEVDAISQKSRNAARTEIYGKYNPLFTSIEARHPDKQWKPSVALNYGIIELKLTM